MLQANTDGNENNDINACSKTYKNKHTHAPEITLEKMRWAISKTTD